MANERQIAANRRNARKSTGPRSSAGKRRTNRNSYRHGLTASVTLSTERIQHIERLARKIAGKATDVVILNRARDAAQAELELAQIRRVKVALIERMVEFGEFQATPPVKSTRSIIRLLNAIERGKSLFGCPSKPRRLCLRLSPSAWPKQCDARCRNCASLTDPSAAPRSCASERFALF